jgi:DNA-binding response OmpR family regulator
MSTGAKKILVVEDDRPSAAVMAYKLKASGYTVVCAGDGSTAVSLVRAENPDLMILDLGLPAKDPFNGPNWDGFGVMDWLHRSQPTQQMPIIVVTAWDPMKAKKRSLDAGAVAFFQKPAQFPELLAAIRNALGESNVPPQTQPPLPPPEQGARPSS